ATNSLNSQGKVLAIADVCFRLRSIDLKDLAWFCPRFSAELLNHQHKNQAQIIAIRGVIYVYIFVFSNTLTVNRTINCSRRNLPRHWYPRLAAVFRPD